MHLSGRGPERRPLYIMWERGHSSACSGPGFVTDWLSRALLCRYFRLCTTLNISQRVTEVARVS